MRGANSNAPAGGRAGRGQTSGGNMNLVCTRCGKRWKLDEVLRDESEAFGREGGLIHLCPRCPKGKPNLSLMERERLAAVKELAGLLRGDARKLAAALKELRLL